MARSGEDTGTLLAGRYRLEQRIASGGMGIVWRARDELLERSVAVKLLHDALADDPLAAQRMRREALTAAQISHPHMANVYDFIEDDGRPGIIMELVESETLAATLTRDGALPIVQAVRITDQVLAALGAAHDAGIVHRDVKPGNVLLGADGVVKVTDFGIARAVSDAPLTQERALLGTPHYTAPELLRGRPASARSDIYSVGVMLWEMLAGERPFDGDTPAVVALVRLAEPPPPLRERRPEVPVALEEIVMRALARDPEERYPTAAAMRRDLRAALGSRTVSQPRPARTEPPPTVRLDGDAPTVGLAGFAVPAAARANGLPAPGRTSTAVAVDTPPEPRVRRMPPARAVVPLLLLVLLAPLVALVMAAGPDLVGVPRFEGLRLSEARAEAARAGLGLSVTTEDSTEPEGTVIEQSEQPDAQVEPGTLIGIVVSSGKAPCCTVPSIEGRSLSSAEERLEDAGLDLGRITYRVTTAAPAGTVIRQDEEPGAELERGSDVDVVVASAPVERKDDKEGKDEEREGGDEREGGEAGKGNEKKGD